MKKTFVSISMLFIVGCGSESSKTQGNIPQQQTVASPVQEPAKTAQEPVAREPDPASAVQTQETNPEHLKIDPVSGKFDFRYGTWSAGPVAKTGSCSQIHGSVWSFKDGMVGSYPAKIDADGVLSWDAGTYSEIARPDGTGQITRSDATVCDLLISP